MKNFMVFKSFLFLFLFSTYSFSQSFNLNWVNSFKNTSCDDIAVDAAGNSYVIGSFSDTTDFDPGSGVQNLISDTIYGIYIAKYDVNGNYIFAKRLPGQFGGKLNIDKSNNIWVTARFKYTADFDPGSGVQNLTAYQSGGSSLTNDDLYIARYTNNGDYQFAFSIVDSSNSRTLVNEITIDNSGNAYITGSFEETVDFDPSSSSTKLTANSYNGDVFIVKYSTTGSLLYAQHLSSNASSSSVNEAYKLRVDNDNNIYVCGSFQASIDLDPSSTNYIVPALGGIDGFIAKYDSTGSFIFGGGFDGICRAMDVEPDGDFYVGGTMADSMDADFGIGTTMLYSINNFDIWLTHYDKNGNLTSANAFEGNNRYQTHDFYVNPKKELIMTGYIRDTVDFDPGTAGGEFISNGSWDPFAVKFNSNSKFQRGMSFGSPLLDQLNSINGNGSSDFWICGSFRDSVDFDPSSSTAWQSGRGGFLARYDDPDVATSIDIREKELLDVVIYSNEKVIYIDFSNIESVNAQIEIYNLSGQLILQKQYEKSNQLNIPMRIKNPQTLIVKVRNKAGVRVKKVILM